MFAEERHQTILALLRTRGKVTVEELAAEFGVSAPTIRSDLAALDARGLLRRTHGGALPANTSLYEPPFAQREEERIAEKRRIGAAAAEMVREGETILLDAGTTTHEIGLALARSGKSGVTVVTNNLPTVTALMEVPGIEVVVIGGQVQPRRRALLGPLAVEFLQSFHCDRLFLGVSGVDAHAGLTAVDFDAVQVKRAMLERAVEVVVVADSSKVGQAAFARIAPIHAAHLLITDLDLSDEAAARLREAGLPGVLLS